MAIEIRNNVVFEYNNGDILPSLSSNHKGIRRLNLDTSVLEEWNGSAWKNPESIIKLSVDIDELNFQSISDSNSYILGSGLSGIPTILHSAAIYPISSNNYGVLPTKLIITRKGDAPYIGALKTAFLENSLDYVNYNDAIQFTDIADVDRVSSDLINFTIEDNFFLYSDGNNSDWQGDWRIVLFYSTI